MMRRPGLRLLLIALLLVGCAAPAWQKAPVTETPYDQQLDELNAQLCKERGGQWVRVDPGGRWDCLVLDQHTPPAWRKGTPLRLTPNLSWTIHGRPGGDTTLTGSSIARPGDRRP